MHTHSHKKINRYLALLITCGTFLPAYPYTADHTKEISDKYLNSFSINAEDSPKTAPEPTGFLQKIKHKLVPQRVKLNKQALTSRESRETAFIAAPTKTTKANVIDADFADKMKLINGGTRASDHFLSRLTTVKLNDGSERKLTSTIMGEKTIVEGISQPPSDLQEILKRQTAVKELVNNTPLRQNFTHILKRMQTPESHLLAFFKPENEGTKKAISGPYFSDWFGSTINTNAAALETKMRLSNLLQGISITAVPLSIAFGRTFIERKVNNKPWGESLKAGGKQVISCAKFLYPGKRIFKNGTPKIMKAFLSSCKKRKRGGMDMDLNAFKQKLSGMSVDDLKKDLELFGFKDPEEIMQKFSKNPWSAAHDIWSGLLPRSLGDTYKYSDLFSEQLDLSKTKGRAIVTGYIAGPAALYGYTTWTTVTKIRNTTDVLNFIHEKLVNVAKYVKSAEKLSDIALHNPHLAKAIPELSKIIHLTNSSHHSSGFINLIHMLKSNTFTSVSALSRSGRVLAAYKLMYQEKDEFADMLRIVGKIDSLVAVAELYETYKDNHAPYCFIEFIEEDTPYFYAQDFWNPFINPKVVVINTVEFGGNKPRTMILTGPNTGGKSTLIEGALLAAFGQWSGIGSASKIVMTPFAKFTCYHNITDDISLGDSRFKSEVLQSKKQLNSARDLKPGEHSFNIRDEGIVGTDREVGAQAERAFTKQLGEIPNSINLISTHYPELTSLENDHSDLFRNYYMDIIKHDNMKIERTFKLKRGVSTVNIAMNILHEEGVLDLN